MSRYQTRFQTREHAGAELASALRPYRGTGALVLAIPRGGVPVGRVVADALGADFDLVMARRIDAGVALDGTGKAWHTNGAQASSGAGSLRGAHFDQLCRQRAVYTPVRKPADPGGRVVIVVDDGLVSGATMHAALASLRKRHPARLICALPIATRAGLDQLRALADEIVCLDTPDRIESLAHFYHEFQLVSDDRVRQLTSMASAPAPRRAGRDAVASVPALSKAMLIPCGTTRLRAMLECAPNPIGVAVMVHAGGAQRRAARSQYLARKLRAKGLATMLVDLKPDSRSDDAPPSDVDELAARLVRTLSFLRAGTPFAGLPVGLLSAGTAAAAALRAAVDSAARPGAVACVAGRTDLAGDAALRRLETPALLICASGNPESIRINHLAFEQMHCPRQLRLVPASGCGFDDRKALEEVATLTADWFELNLAQPSRPCLGYSG
ncbi:phosphoribosyltransferase [Cupriavidus neocaledonicus]|uniref:Phosphoribosyltransferase n=1 Tax=Cupriavidus neocaledonicus TaxID=1040979 RepID=A0A375HU07_9BURK|nr:phosphoribosyltransferase family protein [Cupriavidus neocaledonicus]SOZ38153.1 Phosphoribosyltransferase [Cupriavidus neocaledonicus]SPD60207.1 Phosphoribosyltransferase [Cupriavidus neocaledonicus]